MKNILRSFLTLIILICLSVSGTAQDKTDVEAIKKQTKNVVNDFLSYIKLVGSERDILENNPWLLKRVSKFFLDGSTIEVSNKYNKNVIQYSYEKYLSEVIPGYAKRYAMVRIEAVPIEEAQLKPIMENGKLKGYTGTIKYKQIFCAKNLNQIQIAKEIPTIVYDYCDTTFKEAKIFIKKLETSGGPVWIIRIGNISVLDTQ